MDGVIAMFFGFGKCIRRGFIFLLLLFLLLGYVKRNHPAIHQEVANWITGTDSAPVSKAVSALVDKLAESSNIRQSVEVFYENFKADKEG